MTTTPPTEQPPTPGAGASIVIPIRLQVTGNTLADIEAMRAQLCNVLYHLITTQRAPALRKPLVDNGITVHKVEVGF